MKRVSSMNSYKATICKTWFKKNVTHFLFMSEMVLSYFNQFHQNPIEKFLILFKMFEKQSHIKYSSSFELSWQDKSWFLT